MVLGRARRAHDDARLPRHRVVVLILWARARAGTWAHDACRCAVLGPAERMGAEGGSLDGRRAAGGGARALYWVESTAPVTASRSTIFLAGHPGWLHL